MGVMLDIFFAAIVATLLIVNLATTNDELLTMRHRNTLQYALQSNSSQLQRLLVRDLRMAGCGAAPGTGVIRADSTALGLRGDFLRDGAQHTVHYALGDSADATMTAHPRDRLLWRSLDSGEPVAYAFGLVALRFTYLDASGGVVTDSSGVRQVRYAYGLESTIPYADNSLAVFVTGGVTPKNLR